MAKATSSSSLSDVLNLSPIPNFPECWIVRGLPTKRHWQPLTARPHLKPEVCLGRLRKLHAVAELRHEAPPDPRAPSNVQARQRGAVHRDACHARLGDRRAGFRKCAFMLQRARRAESSTRSQPPTSSSVRFLRPLARAARPCALTWFSQRKNAVAAFRVVLLAHVSCVSWWIAVCPLLLAFPLPICWRWCAVWLFERDAERDRETDFSRPRLVSLTVRGF